MFRFVAIAAFVAAVILFAVVAIGSPANGSTINEWAFVALAAGLAALSLEGAQLPR